MDCGIYKIESPSGKVYIGQTRDYIKRRSHYNRRSCVNQTKIYHSLLKHGWYLHSMSLVHNLPNDVSQGVLDEYEQLFMDAYRDAGVELLNLKEGGYKGKHSAESRLRMKGKNLGRVTIGFTGKQHSEESKEKTRQKMLGRPSTEKTRAAARKRTFSPLARQRSVEANTGRQTSEKTKALLRITSSGKKHSQEAKDKIKSALTGKAKSPEHVLKMANARKGKKLSEAHKKALLDSRKGSVPWNKGIKTGKSSWNKGIIAWNKGVKFSETSKEKMRQAWVIRKQKQVK